MYLSFGICRNACVRDMSRIRILRADHHHIDFRCAFRYTLCFGIYLDTDLSYIFVHVTEMSMFGVMCNLTCPVIFKTDLNFESFEYIGCVSQSFMTDFYSTVQIDKIS